MQCEQCFLRAESSAYLTFDAFTDKLLSCEACPLVEGEGATLAVRLLVGRHREAAREIRRLRSKVRQREEEIRQLGEGTEVSEQRMANLERLHKASTEELEAQLEIVRQQKEAIRSLSTPMIEVDEGVLAIPIIGVLDAERTQTITQALLKEVHVTGTKRVIVDLTGLAEADAATVDLLLRVFVAVRLLGAVVIVTGMRGRVARALVALGADLSTVVTVRTVREALRMV